MSETAPPDDGVHVCKPGATVYYCPTAGDTESDCHGGFDVCCAHPELHQRLIRCIHTFLRQQHDPHSWEPKPGVHPVHCEGYQPADTSGPVVPPAQTEVEELRERLASFEYAWQRIREVLPTEAPTDTELVEARALAGRWEEKYFEMADKYTAVAMENAALREWLPVLRRAVESLPSKCPYHDERAPHGVWREACCDTGIPARRRALAEEALNALAKEPGQ